ncbi:hydroxylase, partial [Xanthomonas perforans]
MKVQYLEIVTCNTEEVCAAYAVQGAEFG